MRRSNITAIRRRLAATTPGVWKTGDRFGSGTLGSHAVVLSGNLPPLELQPDRNGRNDAAFIAHAHQDVAVLLAELETALAIIDDLVDPDPCWYDHGGKCQAHGQASDERCAHARAQEFLGRHAKGNPSEGNAGR